MNPDDLLLLAKCMGKGPTGFNNEGDVWILDSELAPDYKFQPHINAEQCIEVMEWMLGAVGEPFNLEMYELPFSFNFEYNAETLSCCDTFQEAATLAAIQLAKRIEE